MPKIETIRFISKPYRLHGILHLPNIQHPRVMIGCHGLFANSNSPKQVALAQSCVEANMAYFRFDHRGCGQSEGDFKQVTSLSSRCKDLKSAIKVMAKRFATKRPPGLFGSSLGGAVCIAVAAEIPTGPKVVIATPLSTHKLNRPPQTEISYPLQLSDQFYRDNLIFDLQNKLDKINNILIIHGDMDEIVPVSNARLLYNRCRNPKKIVLQKNGDHSISNPAHQREFMMEALDWIRNGFNGQ